MQGIEEQVEIIYCIGADYDVCITVVYKYVINYVGGYFKIVQAAAHFIKDCFGLTERVAQVHGP